jgi:hypothetical protein
METFHDENAIHSNWEWELRTFLYFEHVCSTIFTHAYELNTLSTIYSEYTISFPLSEPKIHLIILAKQEVKDATNALSILLRHHSGREKNKQHMSYLYQDKGPCFMGIK